GELDRLVLLALLGFLDVSVPATQLLSHVLPRVVSWVVNLLFVPIDRELGSVFQFIDLWDVLRLNWSGSLFWFGKNPRNIVRRRLALDDLVPAGQQVIDLSGCLSRHFSTVFTAQANWSGGQLKLLISGGECEEEGKTGARIRHPKKRPPRPGRCGLRGGRRSDAEAHSGQARTQARATDHLAHRVTQGRVHVAGEGQLVPQLGFLRPRLLGELSHRGAGQEPGEVDRVVTGTVLGHSQQPVVPGLRGDRTVEG